MSDESEPSDTRDVENGSTHEQVESVASRETAPMSEFTARAVGVGIIMFLIGLLITVAIPLAFTLG